MGLHLSIPVFPGVRYTTGMSRRAPKPPTPNVEALIGLVGLVGSVPLGIWAGIHAHSVTTGFAVTIGTIIGVFVWASKIPPRT